MALQTKVYTKTSNTYTLELTLVENSTSTSGNSSSMTYTLKLKSTTKDFAMYGVGASVVLDGKTVAVRDRYNAARISLATYSSVTLLTGTTTVAHDSDGGKSLSLAYTLDMASASYTPGPMQGSGTMTLTNIARGATITSAPNFTDEDSPKMDFSNPAGGTVQVAIYKDDASTALAGYREASGSSYTFHFTSAEISALQKADTTQNTTTVRFYIKSVVGGQTFTRYVQRTLTIANPHPTLNPTVYDSNSTTTSLTGNSGNMVQYCSNAACRFYASAQKGATIHSQKVTCGSKSLTADGTMQDVESNVFVFSVTDSRGNTTTKTVTKNLVPYVKLTCHVEGSSMDGNGVFSFEVSGDFFNGSFGAVYNTLTVMYRYRVDGGVYGSYQSMTVRKVGNSYTASVQVTGLDYTQKYQFQAQVYDRLSTVTTDEGQIQSTPVFDWSETDFNFNVPVTVQGRSVLGCGGTAHLGSNQNNVSTNVTLPLNVLDAAYGGVKLSGGGLYIPESGLYLVGGQIMVGDGAKGLYLGFQVNGSKKGMILDSYVGFSVGYGVIACTPSIVELQAGEVLTLIARMGNAANGVMVTGSSRTRITVTKVY